MIQYTLEKKFTEKQVQKLFLSVGWISGKAGYWLVVAGIQMASRRLQKQTTCEEHKNLVKISMINL